MRLAAIGASVELPVEVVALVVELENLGVLGEDGEVAIHELRVVADQLVEDLAVLFCKVEEQALHPGLWLRRPDSHFNTVRGRVLESTVAAHHEQGLNEWQENSSNVDHVASLADSCEAKAQVLPKFLESGALGEGSQDVLLELRID